MAKRNNGMVRDKHHLYECSVQSVEADLDFAEKVYRKRHGKTFRRLREDFCGTAALACSWIARRKKNEAIGVDLDGPTLAWARSHNVKKIGDAAERLTLIQDDVCRVTRPKVQVTMALNFSYWIFCTRKEMLRYFKAAYAGLEKDGILVLDLFGGSEAMVQTEEEREVEADTCFDGTRVGKFIYSWDQAKFNPINNDFVCHIHFRLKDGTRLKKAFSYTWRFWTLPELREILTEAGFKTLDVYTDDWDDEIDDTNGIYKRRRWFDNDGVWVGYLVASK